MDEGRGGYGTYPEEVGRQADDGVDGDQEEDTDDVWKSARWLLEGRESYGAYVSAHVSIVRGISRRAYQS